MRAPLAIGLVVTMLLAGCTGYSQKADTIVKTPPQTPSGTSVEFVSTAADPRAWIEWGNLTKPTRVSYHAEVGDRGSATICVVRQADVDELLAANYLVNHGIDMSKTWGCAWKVGSAEADFSVPSGNLAFVVALTSCPHIDCVVFFGSDFPKFSTTVGVPPPRER